MDTSILFSMTPEQLASTPAGMPPPGVIPNLSSPPDRGLVMYTAGPVLLALMLAFASLRYYTKAFVWRRTSADDWTTLVAIVGAIVYFILCILVVRIGVMGQHLWNVSIADALSNDMIILGFLTAWVPSIVFIFAKGSFFLLYLNLFKPFRWLRWACYTGLFASCGFYISWFTYDIVFSVPAPGQTWLEAFLSPRYLRIFPTVMPAAAINLALDVYILAIPLAGVWKLQLTPRKKFGAALVFATGLAAVVCSSLNIYFRAVLVKHQGDYTYYSLNATFTTFAEMSIGITCQCMPACAHFFKSKRSSSTSSTTSWARFYPKFRHSLSLHSRKSDTASEKQDTEYFAQRDTSRHGSDSSQSELGLSNSKTYTATTTVQPNAHCPNKEPKCIYVDRTFHAEALDRV